MWWFPSKNIRQNFSLSVLINLWRSPMYWSLIFCNKFLCYMWCVMCEVWCVMFQTWFFVRSWLNKSRGDQKHPISIFSDLFNYVPKLIPCGSRIYTITCKASYERCHHAKWNRPMFSLVFWHNAIIHTHWESQYLPYGRLFSLIIAIFICITFFWILTDFCPKYPKKKEKTTNKSIQHSFRNQGGGGR